MKHTEFDVDAFAKLLIEGDEDGDKLDGLDDLDEFEIVLEGDWVSEHKDETCEIVYTHAPTGRFVAVVLTRRGSYWTDYEYEDPFLCEVFPHEKTIIEYTTKP